VLKLAYSKNIFEIKNVNKNKSHFILLTVQNNGIFMLIILCFLLFDELSAIPSQGLLGCDTV
jgi:hypothetical protein